MTGLCVTGASNRCIVMEPLDDNIFTVDLPSLRMTSTILLQQGPLAGRRSAVPSLDFNKTTSTGSLGWSS
jgi:hypothetical protein